MTEAASQAKTRDAKSHESAIFASPSIIGLDRYAGLATSFLNCHPVLCLLQYERYLLFTEPTLLHAKNLLG
jgi:hypothetical protein